MEYDYKRERFKSLTGEMLCTYVRKNRDYGDSFAAMCARYGAIYPLIHLEEKVARVRSILIDQRGTHSVPDETARDSLLDLANYALMTVLELEEKSRGRKTPPAPPAPPAPPTPTDEGGKEPWRVAPGKEDI